MLVLQNYETESSVARGKRFGFGKNSCTSHNRSIPSNKRFENTTVRGTRPESFEFFEDSGFVLPRKCFEEFAKVPDEVDGVGKLVFDL